MKLRVMIAVLLSGIGGVIVAIGAWVLFFGPGLFDSSLWIWFIIFPKLYLFGVLLAAIIPFIDRTLPEARGTALVIYPLTLGAVLVVAFLLTGDAGDPRMLALSLVFAITALLIYRLVRGLVDHGPQAALALFRRGAKA